MGRNLAEYRLYKSIGYSDAEIELMQQDAKIIQYSISMVEIHERIMELTKYHHYDSDGSWMPGGSKFWDERFEEEWKRKLEKDKFMPHSKREQYKNIVALELSELVEQYINHYGIVGNDLMNIATDEYLEYLTRSETTALKIDQEPDNRELWEKIYERWLDRFKSDQKGALATFSYLYRRLEMEKLINYPDRNLEIRDFLKRLRKDGVLQLKKDGNIEPLDRITQPNLKKPHNKDVAFYEIRENVQ